MTRINEAKILVMATDGFEQRELEMPVQRLRGLGATVEIAAPMSTLQPGRIMGWNGEALQPQWGSPVMIDRRLGEVEVEEYDALVIPGGQMNPDKLRMDPQAVDLVARFVEQGKIVAAVCHGPWLLIEAAVVDGRTMTSWPSLRTDLNNAGAVWVDEMVVADNGLITSRKPGDLEAFVDRIVEEIEEGPRSRGGIGAAIADMLGA